ncbi:hypothetical protein ACFU99_29555 [Streptomyces sp. NPDC057654]|uniref:hypothetical protein n=1 Tax=Streptomyces sp. NPDC057654 TaxID=3346196 RepID=UPI0036C6305B
MPVWRVFQERRSTGRGVAALAVVLLAVLHTLGCAHGPQPGIGVRADALPRAVWTASADPQVRAHAQAGAGPQARTYAQAGAYAPKLSGPRGDTSAECAGIDAPGLSAARAALAAPAAECAAVEPAALAMPSGWQAVAADQPRAGPRGERLRAALGVWRA